MASRQRIPDHIREEAARWITERDAGLLTPDDEARLAGWLAADPIHARAFARLEQSLEAMGQEPVRAAFAQPAPIIPFPVRFANRPWVKTAIAACLALVVVGGVNDWPTRLRADAMTATGERRAVTLDDGSVVTLNSGSAIAVDYRADARRVRLLKGEAAFTVAPDRARPFAVEAGGGSTTALGTRFIVHREGSDTDVTVTEHKVRVAWPATGASADQEMVVREGEAARYGADGAIRPHPVDIDVASGWTRGRLIFVDRPLDEVVAELERYHPGYIHVVGADLAQRRFSGVFPIDDPLGAVDTIQRTLGLRSLRITGRLIFLYT